MSSAKFCQLNWILLNSAKMNVLVKLMLDRILPNSADLIDFCQVLPSSARVYRSPLKTACVHAHASTTKNPDYLTMRYLRYFFSLRNVLFFTRAIPLDLDRIYIIPLNLPWSLFAPLQPLMEFSVSIIQKSHNSKEWVRRRRPLKTKLGCSLCNIHLCMHRPC